MDASAVVALGHALVASGYQFVTTSPFTHSIVNRRAAAQGHSLARDAREIFGFSRSFEPRTLAAPLLALARAAGVLEERDGLLRSTIRFSSLHGKLFAHSSFPTADERAVFFGPDTYRFCELVLREVTGAERVVDIGAGSGAGGIAIAERATDVILADSNEVAIAFADINIRLNGLSANCRSQQSNGFDSLDGSFDVILANPPYIADEQGRSYRDGGGELGESIGVKFVEDALPRLRPGGHLILYTGSPFVRGTDIFHEAVRPSLSGYRYRYREVDPDVFGDEIKTNEAYRDVERIAAIALVVMGAQ